MSRIWVAILSYIEYNGLTVILVANTTYIFINLHSLVKLFLINMDTNIVTLNKQKEKHKQM